MAALVKYRKRIRPRGWRPRDLAVVATVVAVALVAAIGVYMRERRLDAKRRYERQHFLRMHDQRMTEGMTEEQRQEYHRDLDEWARRFDEANR